jgi:hypothetical protein
VRSDLNDVFKLLKTLEEDVKKSILRVNESNEEEFGFNVRSYLRAYASWIEGSIYQYKHIISHIEYKWHEELPTQYQLYLFEYDWKINNSGEPVIQSKKIKTKENLKAFFFVMSKIFNGFEVKIDRGQWEDVLFFYSIRDKMMHPLKLDSLVITKNDIKRCDSGRIWLVSIFSQLREKLLEKIDKYKPSKH